MSQGCDTQTMPARFQPRTFLVEPKRFGRDRKAEWVQLPAEKAIWELAQYRTSWRQHNAAIEMKQLLKFWGVNVTWLARQIDEDADYLRRKLHGEVPMRIEDWFVWAEIAGRSAATPIPHDDTSGNANPLSAPGYQPPAPLIRDNTDEGT